MTTAPSNALDARDIRVAIEGREILRGVQVHVGRSEIVGLLGPSGAGKSTFFSVIAGEIAHEGSVWIDGVDVTKLPLHRRTRSTATRARGGLGYMPQGASVLWDLTVAENLQTFAHVALGTRWTEGEIRDRAARVGLEERLGLPAAKLSGGERRRLELARALVREPTLLVCDEPFAGVDPVGARLLGNLLQDAARSGTAVLFADHHVDEALAICDRALLLLDGAVVVEGAPAEFRKDPLVATRYLSEGPHRSHSDVTTRSNSSPERDSSL